MQTQIFRLRHAKILPDVIMGGKLRQVNYSDCLRIVAEWCLCERVDLTLDRSRPDRVSHFTDRDRAEVSVYAGFNDD